MQAQLEITHEQRKNMDPIGVKKRLEHYEQMLQYHTLMRTKNKMKDFEVEFEEWWQVREEYFTKELEKILVQHKANEIFLRYKLEACQKKFQDFICGSSTSIDVLGHDEKIETGPNGIAQEEEVQIEEPQDLKSGGTQEEEVKQRNHMISQVGAMRRNNHRKLKNKNRWSLF